MEFKDYYATLGLQPTATHEQIKRAYRKLARKFHPDVSKEPDAENRFKAVAEAHEALIDPERRAAYDDIAQRHARGQPFDPPPGWGGGFEFSGRGNQAGADPGEPDFSEFFESIFGRGGSGPGPQHRSAGRAPRQGGDHHARIGIDLGDAYSGARRTVNLRMPAVDGTGRSTVTERSLEVTIPAGVRSGQKLRLAGQGGGGQGGGPAGDLYLEIDILPHPVFRLDGRDVFFDLPLAPWEAALGATVTAPTPTGPVQLTIPPASAAGRQLRLRGKGLPGKVAGDLYAVLGITLPPVATPADTAAYQALASAFAGFVPRAVLPGG
jgi:curved DNA-binding protein